MLMVLKNTIAVHLKHFWPTVDAKSMSTYLEHAMSWQWMFAISMCVHFNLYEQSVHFHNKDCWATTLSIKTLSITGIKWQVPLCWVSHFLLLC
jgi:hypothetical protein